MAHKNGVAVEMIAMLQLYDGRTKRLPPKQSYDYIGGPRVSPVAAEVKDMLYGLLTGKTSAVMNEKSVQPLLTHLASSRGWSRHEKFAVDRATSEFFKVSLFVLSEIGSCMETDREA